MTEPVGKRRRNPTLCGRLSGFVLSLFFVLGIAIIYSTLGVAAALSGGIFGAALQSKAALIVIAAVFVLMAVSMLGAFDLMIEHLSRLLRL